MTAILRKFLLSMALLLCCTATANAANPDATLIDGIYYILDHNNKTATVTENGSGKYSGDIVIPEKVSFDYTEYAVTSIGENAFRINLDLTSITIPSSVTSIERSAFIGCYNLQSVYVSWENPPTISDNVFQFLNTSEITLHITYGTLDAYLTADIWKTFDLDGIISFADANIEKIISATEWDIDHDGHLSTKEAAAVTDLGTVFSNTAITSLNELKYFKNLKSIGERAFEGCSNLKSVTIPASVTSIGENAFKDCSGLEEIYVKVQNPLSISSNVFENVATTCLLRVPYGSDQLYKAANVWKNFTNIQDNAIHFEDPGVEAICLANWDTNNDGVLTYEEAAAVKIIDYFINTEFVDKSNITSFDELKYFTGLEKIGAMAFYGCKSLTSITIPSSVTNIGEFAFKGCVSLTSITIPNSVTSIGEYAFRGCTGLSSVTIPNSVTSIGKYAFKGCTGLSSVTIPNSVTSIGVEAFNGCTGLTSITIPSSVTSIGDDAFNGCTGLSSVTIPNSVTSIGEDAFNGCTGLTSVTIPSSVTYIGSNAFEGCTELETVSVQWTEAEKIPDISGKDVFKGITLSDVTLNIPYPNKNIRPLYATKDVWKDFNIASAKNTIITKSDNTTLDQKASEDGEIVIDESANDIKKISVIEDVTSVKSITYKRDFTNVTGKWQTWFVPFEAPVDVLDDAGLDAAEVAGILLNSEGETIVAFKMIDDNSKKMHANTPYVVRMRSDADSKIAELKFENAKLKITEENSFSIQSAYDKFTFTGNYEFKTIDDSYTLNKNGEFMKMGAAVSLKPMRFSLSVSSRDDSPYISQSNPKAVIRYMVLDDDSTLQPIDDDLTGVRTTRASTLKRNSQRPMRIYDLRGRKVNNIQSKQVYIIDGKTYTAR